MTKWNSRFSSAFQQIKSYRHIVTVLMRYGFEEVANTFKNRVAFIFMSKSDKAVTRDLTQKHSRPVRLRLALEELGPTFIKFGQLLTKSHDGDRVVNYVDGKSVPTDDSYPDEVVDALIADLKSGDSDCAELARLWRQPGGYDVSVPEIDLLVDIALATEGVIGAGLVGAGMGGSLVAVVKEENAQQVIDNMAEKYFTPRDLPLRAEIVSPVAGCAVMDV